MTAYETAMMAGGAMLVVLFLLETALPAIGNGLRRRADRTAQGLRAEFLSCPPGATMAILVVAGILAAAAGYFVTRAPAGALVSGTLPVLLPGTAVRLVRRRRQRAVVVQLPGFLDLLGGYARSGHSLPGAFADAMPLLPRGIREEVAWLMRVHQLGTPLPDALRMWERRLPCEELSLFIRPLIHALPNGGDVASLLTRCRDIMRARLRAEVKMRTLTVQARLQAAVLTLLPPGFAAALSAIDATFLPSLTGTTAGRLLIGAAVVLQLLGWMTIRRILKVRP